MKELVLTTALVSCFRNARKRRASKIDFIGNSSAPAGAAGSGPGPGLVG